MRFHGKILLILALALAACTVVEKAEYRPVLPSPEDAHASPMMFSGLKIQFPPGSEIGSYSPDCFWPSPVGRSILHKAAKQKDIEDVFENTLESQGYDVVGTLNLDFDEEIEDEYLRSEYRVSGKIKFAQIDACHQSSFLLLDHVIGRSGFRGQLRVDVEWSVMDALRRKTVYKTRTAGYAEEWLPDEEGLNVLLNDAFGMAAHNLGADPAFHALIFEGKNTGYQPPRKKEEDRPRSFDPLEKVNLENIPLSTTPVSQHIQDITATAVLVQGGLGHGSGYFISKQGHIITNHHVVGNAMRVRVVTKGKQEKLIAEVLRSDPIRDAALLKLEEMPPDLDIHLLPVRTQWPAVSDEIYAIGAPQSTRLQDTITKGIVSAHRKNFKIFDSYMDFIQGDVSVHGGNSGGPLVDANGNLVGMSVAGLFPNQGKRNSSLNLFIPIEDALKALDIDTPAPAD